MSHAEPSNLLIALHPWAHRQDENFLTDAFAHLLRQMLTSDSRVGVDLVAKLTNGVAHVDPESARTVRIRTQVTGPLGRPDMVISWANQQLLVEVKLGAGLGDQQLERYLKDTQGIGPDKLVLLSRFAVDIDAAIQEQVISRRWYQVAEWLEYYLKANLLQDPIARHFVAQFLDFLEYRGMTMERIGPELVSGIAAIRNLALMIERWLGDRQRSVRATFGREWFGCYTPKDTQHYFIGVYHDRPRLLVFETYLIPVAEDAARSLGVGRVTKGTGTPRNRKWVNEFDLDADEDSFFAASKERQMELLDQFLSKSLALGEQLRMAVPASAS